MIEGLKFKGYKSFQSEYVDIKFFDKINIFIGRNNSGKSSCLDIIENLTNPYSLYNNKFLRNGLELQVAHTLTDSDISRVFRKDWSNGDFPSGFDYEYNFGKNFIGKVMYFSVTAISMQYRDVVEKDFGYEPIVDGTIFENRYKKYWRQLVNKSVNVWSEYRFRRLNAERDIVPEVESAEDYLTETGKGASNLVRKIINHSDYDETLVQKKVLKALNDIMLPDAKFDAIKIQQINDTDAMKWEIFLQEEENRYALSKMGSGLKTILIVLLNLIVIPELKEYKDKKMIYAFEELENNLHPALQRRLFDFLYEFSKEKEVVILLTTHSHVAINTFCDKENTQIFHVEKENGLSKLHKVDDYISKTTLLNDLDVRASDLLQSNGIVWVEGPSDRVYIKRWLEIFGGNDVEEGRDYQFLYYGGRLLSHYTAEPEREYNDLINVFFTNRNSAIVIDSDKRYSNDSINSTKKRIKEECKKIDAFCWVTKGREIENYLPKEAIEAKYNKQLEVQCAQFESFPEFIKGVCANFSGEKVAFANKVVPYITVENATEILDLKIQVEKLYSTIKKWNSK